AGHLRLSAELTLRSDLARHARYLAGEGVELIHHRIDGVLELEDLAAYVDGDLARQVAAGDGGRHVGDVAHLHGEVSGHCIDVSRQVLPRATDARHTRLTTQPPLGADLARHATHLVGEHTQLLDHVVDRVLEVEHFPANLDGDFLRQIAVGHRGCHQRDVTDLIRQVRRHEVHVVREFLPRAGDALHAGLPAEYAFGAHLAGYAGHLRGEGGKLVDHRVDRVLEREHLAFRFDRDRLRQ